jgi:cytochrome c biogenesis protein CcmG, thiol:disulfide interchange protein DsbE
MQSLTAQFFRRVVVWVSSVAVTLVGITVVGGILTGRLMLRPPEASVAAAQSANMPAPSLTLPLADGSGSLGLSALKGKPVYLNFFASWCPPCNMEAPELAQLDREYASRGLVMLGVDEQESPNRALGFRNRYSLPYRILLDSDGSAGSPFGASALPVQVLIDRNGRIAWTHVGMVDDADARPNIERALKARR